jgi:hypothetical protein
VNYLIFFLGKNLCIEINKKYEDKLGFIFHLVLDHYSKVFIDAMIGLTHSIILSFI